MRNYTSLAATAMAVALIPAAAVAASAAEWQAHRARLVRELRASDFQRLAATTRGLVRFDGQAAAGVAVELLYHRNPDVSSGFAMRTRGSLSIWVSGSGPGRCRWTGMAMGIST